MIQRGCFHRETTSFLFPIVFIPCRDTFNASFALPEKPRVILRSCGKNKEVVQSKIGERDASTASLHFECTLVETH